MQGRNIYNEPTLVWTCQYHCIWCPKYRRPVLVGDVETRLKELILEKQKEYGYNILELEVMPDHVHLLVEANPQIGVHAIISKIKGYTSRVIRSEFPSVKRRIPTLWTHSKYISTVGTISLQTAKRYIEEQKTK